MTGLWVFAFPVLVVICLLVYGDAWLMWYRDLPRLKDPKWRSDALLSGLVAGSASALLLPGYGWFLEHPNYSYLWLTIGAPLCAFVLLTAAFGKGPSRSALAVAALLEMFLWYFIFIVCTLSSGG